MDLVKPYIEYILYPIMEKYKGNETRYRILELQESQYIDQCELRKLQQEKLRKLLLECITNVPAYQSFAYLRNHIESDALNALYKFPVLEKNAFQNNPNAYLNQTVSKNYLIANCTGGSTSEPVKFYMDRLTVEYYEAARWRGLSWWDIKPASRCVMIWGNPLELNQAEQWKYRLKEKWLKNRIIIPAYCLKPEAMPKYIKDISRFKPEYFYGYSSALYAFSKLIIEKAFGCPVVNEYGARDAGILAYQCINQNMHISVENAILEVVDATTLQPLPLGQSGSILVTDLNNFSMPRLRYRLGDRATLSTQLCACGIKLPLIEKIDGREDDMFLTVDGQLVHGHAFNHISRNLNAINKFQIIQLTPEHAELSIVPNHPVNTKEIEIFINNIQKMLPGTIIDVKQVDNIPASSSGKYRYAIRKFPLENFNLGK